MSLENKHFYEFGRYRLDPEQRQLFRDHQPVALQPKAFETLLVLIQNSQKVVPKDELMKNLWPDSFVEESNLSQNIFVLRKALGEDGNRYIVTVPGRGYRFVANVRVVRHDELAAATAAGSETGGLVVETHTRSRMLVEEPPLLLGKPRPSRRTTTISATLIVVLVAAAIMLFLYSRRTPRLTTKDTVVLADFINTTGDPVFDGTLRQGLSAQLEQSPFLNLLSDVRIAQTLALMSQAKDARLTPNLAREVCLRTGSTAMIEGSIAALGSQYVLGIKAVSCHSGDALAEEQLTANRKEEVLKALGEGSTRLRKKLGESIASVERYDAPPENVTTPSLEALQAYSLGYRAHIVKDDPNAAVPFFQQAITLDPNFAMAWARLGTSYGNRGENARAAECTRKAYELRQRVSERERFYIDSHFQDGVTNDLEAARAIYESWAQVYPHDPVPPVNLGRIYLVLGDYEKAAAAVQEDLRLDPGSGLAYANLVSEYLHLNRLDEAKAAAIEARARNLDSARIHLSLYLIDFLQHDAAGMEREGAQVIGAGHETIMLYNESQTAAYAGHFNKARELTRRAVQSAERADQKEAAAGYGAAGALREALAGNMRLALQQAQAALALSKGRDVEGIAAIALGLAGNSAQALQLDKDLSERFPKDTMVQSQYLPMIRASAILGSGDLAKHADQAIDALAAAAPHELGNPDPLLGFALFPAYVRGEAYVASHRTDAAAAEFQKIVDHPGVVQNELIGSLALLQLGRALALSGDREKAAQMYKEFLTICKDADPDLRIVQAARGEFTKLNGPREVK